MSPRKSGPPALVNALTIACGPSVVGRAWNRAGFLFGRRGQPWENRFDGPHRLTEAAPGGEHTRIVAVLDLARIYFPQ